MKITLYMMAMLLILSLAYAGECPRFGIIQQDIPCVQPSSWNPDSCDANVTVWNSTGGEVLFAHWYNYAPYCAFNITGLNDTGTYCYNSTIEDGCITLGMEDNMLALMIGIGMIVLFFIGMGFLNREFKLKIFSFGIGLVEIIVAFSLLYARELGKDITGIMTVNFYALIILAFGVGMISIIMFSIHGVNYEEPQQDEKWESDKWGR